MQDFHKLMQCFSEINAKEVSAVWKAIESNQASGKTQHNVGAWHSADGKVYSLEIGVLNTGGRMLKVEIGQDGKFVASIVFPDMD